MHRITICAILLFYTVAHNILPDCKYTRSAKPGAGHFENTIIEEQDIFNVTYDIKEYLYCNKNIDATLGLGFHYGLDYVHGGYTRGTPVWLRLDPGMLVPWWLQM